MSGTGNVQFGRCHVAGGDNLPATTGGSEALCREIANAITRHAPHAKYSVAVNVISTSRLSATLVVNGHVLPEQRFAVMDSELSPGSIARFAEALALVVAEAQKA